MMIFSCVKIFFWVAACASEPEHDFPEGCPDPNDECVDYMHETWEERGICISISFACREDETYIPDECGCGCMCAEQ